MWTKQSLLVADGLVLHDREDVLPAISNEIEILQQIAVDRDWVGDRLLFLPRRRLTGFNLQILRNVRSIAFALNQTTDPKR